MRNEFGSLVGSQVKIIADTCDGNYEDMIGKMVTVVEETEMDDNMMLYTVLTGRKSNNTYLDNGEEIVYSGDVELV